MNGTMTVKWRCACGGRGCGCCEGTVALTPQPTANRPGLSALSYRIGTHGSILQTMKARLSSEVLDAKGGAKDKPKIEPKRPLAGLRTRDGSDPAIALLDAWATVADVLTFYQERIANEGYLRTATEMRSMFELSRLVGYQPRPGVASSVYLAYTIDANTPQEIVVPQGARAQTVPGQDELPQSFETSQDLKARAGWNRLGLRKSEPQQWNDIQRHGVLYLAGTQTRLKPGDPLLLDAGGPVDPENVAEPPTPYRVLSVDADPRVDRTAVRIEIWNSAAAKKAVGEKLLAIIRDAPKGKFADKVQQALTHLHGIAADDVTIARARNELRGLVRQQQEGSESQPEGPLKPWLARVAAALDEMPAATAAPAEGLPAASALEERIGRLIAPPSKPRANALQLPRSLSSSFEPIGDAGLKMLVAIAPALKPTLAPALAGYEGASPQQSIRVWALRLHAGLFGRAFQRRTKIEFGRKPDQEGVSRGVATISKTVDDGEWPIITSVKKDRISAREVPHTVYLDAAHDGIAPGSWVFIDASAVDRGAVVDENVKHAPMVLPVQTLLVSRVKVVFPKVSRADYGSSGDTTALELSEPWIRFTVEGDEEFRTLGASQVVVDRDFQTIRRTAVYAKSEALALAERPIEEPLCTGSSGGGGARLAGTPRAQVPSGPIELDGLYAGIEAGRFVIVSGERADIDATRGVFASEPVMITSVVHDVRAAGTKPDRRAHV